MQNQITDLRSLARQARDYQLERGWSDAVICREIAHLGSTKTFKRILDPEDDLDELNLDKQLKNYTAAVATIQGRRAKDRLAEPEYEDFTNITESRAALQRAMEEESVARFVCIEGESSTGKDAVKNTLCRIWPKITVAQDANTFWEYSLATPTADLSAALDIRRKADGGGAEPMPRNPMPRARVIIEELQKRKLILMINEGHHCGRQVLDLLKMIINETPTVLVMLCIPSLLAKLVRTEYATANQLFSNRLCQRLQLPTPPADEIALMCERRGVKWDNGATENEAVKTLAEQAPALGNWRYVSNVTRELVFASRKSPITPTVFKEKRDLVQNRRVVRANFGRAA